MAFKKQQVKEYRSHIIRNVISYNVHVKLDMLKVRDDKLY